MISTWFMYSNARADVKKNKNKQKKPHHWHSFGGGVTLFEKQMNFDDIKRYECTDLLKVNSNFIHVVCWGKNTHKTFNQKLIVIRIKANKAYAVIIHSVSCRFCFLVFFYSNDHSRCSEQMPCLCSS